jgi:predicted  nucleic acid-binding Zn-ribbon protein
MEIDRNAPATKGDVADLSERLEMLRTEVQHGYDDLREAIRDSQTEMLKAFYSFAQSNSKRFAELEGNEAAIRSRLGTIEDRLMELERRVITPPPH